MDCLGFVLMILCLKYLFEVLFFIVFFMACFLGMVLGVVCLMGKVMENEYILMYEFC